MTIDDVWERWLAHNASDVDGDEAIPLKLFQPAHERYYLAAASLVCRQPGLPERTARRVLGDVVDEVADDRSGDHVADVLGDGARVSLESHPDDLFILEDGATAVAGVDGGVDLDGEVVIDGRMAVGPEVDA